MEMLLPHRFQSDRFVQLQGPRRILGFDMKLDRRASTCGKYTKGVQ